MKKLSTSEIRARALELLDMNQDGLRFSDLVRTIAAESPETPFNTINTQIGDMPSHYPHLVFRPSRGVFQRVGGSVSDPSIPVRTPSSAHVPNEHVPTLLSLGFVQVGHWEPVGDRIEFKLVSNARDLSVLYAFCIDDQVMYIGKTTRSLMQRMQNFQTPGVSQSTNVRNNGLIGAAIKSGQTVKILALEESGELIYRGFNVSLVDGLESTLLAHVSPPWNVR